MRSLHNQPVGLNNMKRNTQKINFLIESSTFYNVMTRNAPTAEKRLMKDIKAAREVYDEKIIDDII